MMIFQRKQEPIVIVRITRQLYGSMRMDLIPHNFEGPTTSYSTIDGETFYYASGAEQKNPKILAHLRALVADWKADFYTDLSIRAA